MKTKILLTFVLAFTGFALKINIYFAQGTWQTLPDFPGTSRYASTGFSINGKGYVITGYHSSGPVLLLNDTWEYDPVTGTWTQKAPFPGTARWYASSFSIAGKGYLGMGTTTNDFWEFDPLANTWTQKNNFPGRSRAEGISFSVGTKGYFGLGAPYGTSSYMKDFWEYNSLTDTWIQLQDFPGGPRGFAISFVIGQKGYVGTGQSSSIPGVYHKDLWEFDPATNSWIAKQDLPLERSSAVAYTLGNYGYVGMGETVTGGFLFPHDNWRFNPDNNQWDSVAALPYYKWEVPVTFTINNSAYVVTGFPAESKMWVYCESSSQLTSINGNSALCFGTSYTYNLEAASSAFSYTWTLPSGWSGSSTTDSITVIPNLNGGTLSVIAANACGSSSPETLAVTVNPLPAVTYTQSPSIVCENSFVPLASVKPAGGTFSGTGITNNTFYPSAAGTGTFPIVYTYTDANSCTNTAASEITVLPAPKASFSASYSLNCNDVTAHLINTSPDAAAYQWKFSDGSTSMQNDPDYHFNYNAPYSISLIAINSNTCSDTASVIKNSSIEDYLNFNISNVFTPNGDGINDEFQLGIDTEVSECFSLTIFDRWGNTMFKSSDGSHKWDGRTISGAKAAAGTYFYVIDINNAKYKGFVSLSE